MDKCPYFIMSAFWPEGGARWMSVELILVAYSYLAWHWDVASVSGRATTIWVLSTSQESGLLLMTTADCYYFRGLQQARPSPARIAEWARGACTERRHRKELVAPQNACSLARKEESVCKQTPRGIHLASFPTNVSFQEPCRHWQLTQPSYGHPGTWLPGVWKAD